MRIHRIGAAFAAFLGTACPVAAQNWHVETDPTRESIEYIEKIYRDHGIPVAGDAMAFEITRPDVQLRDIESIDRKKERIDGWQSDIVGLLEDEGFEEISDHDLHKYMHVTRQEMREKLIQSQPFGRRESTEQHMAKSLDFMLNRDASCSGDQGGEVALVEGQYPDDSVGTAYGSVVFVIFGLGECGDADAGEEMEDMRNHVQHAFLKSLGAE